MLSLFKPFSLSKGTRWQRFLCSCLVVAIIINGLPTTLFASSIIQTAQAAENSPELKYGLVAILVDKNTLESNQDYEGLSKDYSDVDDISIRERIERYAEDVQAKNSYTKASIISVDTAIQGAPEIASTLEKLYFDGDGTGENAKLMGVVVVGDVPLPVVNKKGNRFLSMLPYTDFEDKSYVYNPTTNDFEFDNRVNFPRVEVWHGVISPPKEAKNTEEKASSLAKYFDKNHLYQIGNKDFAEFEKGALISDLYHERQLMSTGFFDYYKLFQENAEDLTYLRNNKHWAEDLYRKFAGDVAEEAKDVLKPEYKDFLNASAGLFGNLPDIQSKQAVIDKYHLPYVKLFSSYLSKINDWTSYTGRYLNDEVQSVPELISVKDQYTSSYLMEVNTALENKMDEIVKKSLQRYIPIISHSTVSGGIVVKMESLGIEDHLPFAHEVRASDESAVGGADSNFNSPLFVFLNSSLILHAKEQWPKALSKVSSIATQQSEATISQLTAYRQELIEAGNTVEAQKVSALIEEKQSLLSVQASLNIDNADSKLYINGKPLKDINGPLDCSLYRGSTLLTVNSRLYNPNTAGNNLFLGAITDPVLKYGNYQQGLLVREITPNSPAEKAGIAVGDLLLDFNGQVLNKDFGDGARLMLEDILPRLDSENDTQATVKYFSKSQNKEIGPVKIALEDANDPKWANGCFGTNGIEIDGKDNGEKCIAELSKIPLFDAGAGKEISADQLPEGDVDEANINSCYDVFYTEEPRYLDDNSGNLSKPAFVKWIEDFFDFNDDGPKTYLNPLAKFVSDYQQFNAQDIVLYNKNNIELSFTDVLKHAGAFDGVDNDLDGQVDESDENDLKYAVNPTNWGEIGSRILSRSGTFRVYIPEIESDIDIKIEPNVVKWIDSMIPHKDPTNKVIGAQARAQGAKSLPIDGTRYLAFEDKNGVLQKFDYPNLFDANSYQDLQVKLYKLSKKLSEVPGSEKTIPTGSDDGATEAIYRQLLDVINTQNFEDAYTETDTGHQLLTSTFENKVTDALNWSNLGIDDKHDYVISTYLSPEKDAYIAERNGYEALYLVADGEHDYASYSFYGDYAPSALDVNTNPAEALNTTTGASSADANQAESEADNFDVDTGTIYDEVGKKKSKIAIPLVSWFSEMIIWIEETVSSVQDVGYFAFDSFNEFPDQFKKDSNGIEDAVVNELKATEGTVAELKISIDKGTLSTNSSDYTILTVKALDKTGRLLVNENKTSVELVVAGVGGTKPSESIVLSTLNAQIIKGSAAFKIASNTNPGDVILQVASTNLQQRLLSNAVQLKVTKRNISIVGSNEIEAGSTTPLEIEATLRGDDGDILLDENGKRMSFELGNNSTQATLSSSTSTVASGVASTTLNAGTQAGLMQLRAQVNSSLFPAEIKDIYVMPSTLSKINISPKSSVIKSGGISYTPVRIQMEDAYGNVKNNSIYQLTIWHDGPGEFKNIQDEDPLLGGYQVTVPEGVFEFEMASTEEVGPITIHAQTNDFGFYNNATVLSRNDIFVDASANVSELQVGGETQALISVNIKDNNGVLEGANLPLNLSISQETLANFNSEIPTQTTKGKAAASVQSQLVSGKTNVVAVVPGFETVNVPIKINPLSPYKVEFVQPQSGLVSDATSTLEVEAKILDIYGNFVDQDSATKVTFSISEATKQVAEFLSASELVAQNGKVSATLKSTLNSGPVRIKAVGAGLQASGEIEFSSEKRMPTETFKNSNAKVLFASLMGNAFGDVSKSNSLASGLLYSGFTEAISATTTAVEQKKSLFTWGANGHLQVLDDSLVKFIYSASGNQMTSDKVSLIDSKTNSVLAEVTLQLPGGTYVHLPQSLAVPVSNENNSGVFLNNFIKSSPYSIQADGSDALILYNQIPHVRISGRGQISVLQGKYNILPLVKDQQQLTFQISSGNQKIVEVQILPSVSNDTILVDENYNFSFSSPVGAYLIRKNQSANYQVEEFFTGNSTNSRKGLSWVDTTQAPDAEQTIGGSFASLESAFDKTGIGFTGQNKHMLLFFAGNSVGESFMPYASETGIILGDPTVKLAQTGVNNGFNADLGESIYTGNTNIKSLQKIDYNVDGVEDVLIAYEDGKVKILEGITGNTQKPFEDKGYLLNVVNGIYSIAVGDINNDNQDDIVVATKESCNVGETCVYLFENFNGHFIQKNAGLDLKEKVSDLKIVDLNKDGYSDLVVADLNRSVLVYYGSNKGLNTTSKYIGGLEATAKEGLNTAHQTFISYNRSDFEIEKIANTAGFNPLIPMTLPSANSTDGAGKDQPLSADNRSAVADLASLNLPGVKVTPAPVYGKKIYNFLPLDNDLRLKISTKKTKDENGGDVKSGDKLNYTIELVNTGDNLSNATVLDYVPETFVLDKNSVKCENCTGNFQVLETGIPSRPYLFTGINLVTNQSARITYTVSAGSFPPLQLIIGDNFGAYPQDEYLDINAFPEGKPESHVVFYSTKQGAEISYTALYPQVDTSNDIDTIKAASTASTEDVGFEKPSLDNDKNNNGVPDNYDGIDEDTKKSFIRNLLPNTEKLNQIAEQYTANTKDKDLDGIPDVMDAIEGKLQNVAGGIEDAIGALKCSGGCIPLPINTVLNLPFPVPGNINVMGIPVGYVPGIPIFAITKPSTLAPPAINTIIWPAGNPFYFDSIFRIYASPTLTGGLGTAMCLGEYAWTPASKANSCFIFAVPLLQALGVCKALSNGIQGALSSIKSGIISEKKNGGLTTVVSMGSNPQAGNDFKTTTGFSSGPFPVSASVASNVRIPGFPSVIVNWFDRQTEEIVDKLMDLPDIYLILPEPESLLGGSTLPTKEWADVSDMNDFLAYINSIPLVELEQKEITIKVPWLYEDQLEKTIREYEQWSKNLKLQSDIFRNNFGCDTNTNYSNVCNKVTLDVDSIVSKMEKNIQLLNDYRELPKKLLKFRQLEAQYVSQIVTYLDTIINYTGGYIQKQGDRVTAWIKAIDQIKKVFRDWKVIVDISLTYAESCDACKTDRFSLLEFLLRFLVIVPEPPIIEMPKWPDIVIDVSQIQSGLKLVVPDFVFVPEAVVLPPLPQIRFPEPIIPQPGIDSNIPDVNIKVNLPDLPLIPEIPELKIPDLPQLPPLPLPTLPDIPPPPKIPELPKPVYNLAQTFNTLFRIFCLVKTGLMPLPEPEVATEFETLTQRGLSPLLPAPFDMSASFQLPPFSYDYVNQIEIIAKLNLQLDINTIYEYLQNSADLTNSYNAYGKNYVDQLLKEKGELGQEYIFDANDIEYQKTQINVDVNIPIKENPSIDANLSSFADMQNVQVAKSMFDYLKEVEKINDYSRSIPKEIVIKAESHLFDPSSEIFDKSIDDIKKSIAHEQNSNLMPAKLIAYRDNLIAHHDSLQNGTSNLQKTSNERDFMRMLAQQKQVPLLADSSFDLPNNSLSLPQINIANDPKPNAFTQNIKEANDIQERIIALTDDEKGITPQADASPKGVFIFDEKNNINQNLISYTEELGSVSHLAYINVDDDDDEDILYSFGGDIYLKRNLTQSPKAKPFSGSIQTLELSKLIPNADSINHLTPTSTSNEKVSLAWDKSNSANLQAYEMEIKYRLNDFNDVETAGSLAHIIPDTSQIEATINRPDYYTYEIVKGDLTVNGQNVEASKIQKIRANDLLQTSTDLQTEIHLNAFDKQNNYLGLIKVGPATKWVMPRFDENKNSQIVVQNGEVIFELKDTLMPFLATGDTIKTGANATVLINYQSAGSFLIYKNQQFTIAAGVWAPMFVADSSILAQATITGKQRFMTTTATGTVQEGDLIHMVEPSTLQAKNSNGDVLMEISQTAHSLFTVPNGLPTDVIFYVSTGKVEVIRQASTKIEQKLVDGGMIDVKDFVTVYKGDMALMHSNSLAQVKVSANQNFALYKAIDPQKPTAEIEILNGNYYASMRSLLKNNTRGTSALSTIIAPQSCGDKSAPYINVGATEKSIAVFQSASVNASASFDTAGKVVAYYADTNLEVDSDGNGNKTDDKDLFSDDPNKNLDTACFKDKKMDNPVFNFGPYNEPGEYKVKIYAIDQSCNINSQEIIIKVFVPDIYLDTTSARGGILSGHIEPPLPNVPIRFIRDRKPPLENFSTASADENGIYYTNSLGEFEVADLQKENIITVSDDSDEEIAEVDPYTGDLEFKKGGYSLQILPARPPDFPTRATITDQYGESVASFFIVPDLNNDTTITNEIDITKQQVQIQPQNNDNFKIEKLPSSDLVNPGATTITYVPENKKIALINSSGNIFTLDDRVTLGLTSNNDKIYNIHLIQILFSQKLIATVYLPGQNTDGFMPTIAERDVYKFNVIGVVPPTSSQYQSPFADVNADTNNSEAILNLAEKGIIDGYNEDGLVVFKPDQLIGRAEYTKILLKTLCIQPSDQAFLAPPTFSDIVYDENNLAWYYPFVKEAYLQGFISGYAGEQDPATGLNPFKAGNTITRAEAAVIILSALNRLETVNLESIKPGDPWYAPYMEVAQNLGPYLNNPQENSQLFLLTAEEALNPEKQISRSEFAVMAERVLNINNCFTFDDDNDGMPSEWEKTHNLDPYNAADAEYDNDNDGLINREEYENGTDPFNPDTDGGCMLDGPEVRANFNPAKNPDDDDPDFDGLSCNLENNTYKTDPYKADTDGGGINDGREVLVDKTDPLLAEDDNQGRFDDVKTTLDEGVYAIEQSCNSCPCDSSISNKSDILVGDEFWAVIASPTNANQIYKKSNSVTITDAK